MILEVDHRAAFVVRIDNVSRLEIASVRPPLLLIQLRMSGVVILQARSKRLRSCTSDSES